jgi:hypothetical protein
MNLIDRLKKLIEIFDPELPRFEEEDLLRGSYWNECWEEDFGVCVLRWVTIRRFRERKFKFVMN